MSRSTGTIQTASSTTDQSIETRHPSAIMVTQQSEPRAPMRRSWLGQLAEMLRKSALIKKRRRKATLQELGYPAYFIMILWLIKTSLPGGVDYPAAIFSSSVPIEQPGPLTCRWHTPSHGSFIPGCDSTNATATGRNGTWGGSVSLGYVNTSAPAEVLAQKAVAALGPRARAIGFTSTAAMESYALALQTNDAAQLDVAKLFYGVEFSDDTLSYTLRFMPQPPGVGVPAAVAGTVLDATDCRPYWKQFDRPGTSSAQGQGTYSQGNTELESALPTTCASLKYLTDGFLDLQVALDRAVLQSKLGETTSLQVQVQPLPRVGFQTNFASQSTALRSIFSIYLVLPLTSPVRWMITFLVEEKEQKIKEGMLMMGLHYSVFWAVSTRYLRLLSLLALFLFPADTPLLCLCAVLGDHVRDCQRDHQSCRRSSHALNRHACSELAGCSLHFALVVWNFDHSVLFCYVNVHFQSTHRWATREHARQPVRATVRVCCGGPRHRRCALFR
eukprot:COSAG02_NODE_157_length_32999_cov_31.863647_15_plen_501_part_00